MNKVWTQVCIGMLILAYKTAKAAEWKNHNLQHIFTSPSNRAGKIEKENKLSKMKGSACFTLDSHGISPDLTSGAAGLETGAWGTVQRAAGAAEVMQFPSRRPYAVKLGTYTQWCMA